MNKEARLLCLWLVTAVAAGFVGCAHKPAYSDMDPNKSRNQNQNQSAEAQATAAPPVSAQPPSTDPAQPAQVPAPTAAPVPRPTFLDEAKGGIKDLPSYPNAYRVSSQLGPIQGVNTMSLGFNSTDSMDKITAFFERVIKENKWTVTDKLIDPEFSEWNLKKGEDNNAKVQVKKDQLTGALTIVLVRGEKLNTTSK